MAGSGSRARMAGLTKELTIAGGGLAGLSLAVALRLRGVPVTVLEAGHYPRHRVCGEFISGVGPETLEALGISDLFDDAKRQRSVLWCGEGRMWHRNFLPVAALGISRHELDLRLSSRFLELGGELRTGYRCRPVPADGFVWAGGRKARTGRWVGLKCHARLGDRMEADLEMHSGTNGYVGLAGVEDGWVNVCGLFRIDETRRGRAEELLASYLEGGGNQELANALRDSEVRPGSFSSVAGFELGRQVAVAGLCVLGDAESMIPPFTGNGMSMAFQAAETAIEPLCQWASDRIAWQTAVNQLKGRLRQRFRRRLFVARLLHRVLLDSGGRSFLRNLGALHLLPFHPMLSLVR